jgi:hypothetical protein
MRRIHTFAIAVVLAVAAAAGLFAVSRTTQLGAATRSQVPARQLAARNRQLDKIEKALLAQAQRSPQAGTQPSAQAGTIYVRPKPIFRVVHHAGGEHENEAEGDGGFDD